MRSLKILVIIGLSLIILSQANAQIKVASGDNTTIKKVPDPKALMAPPPPPPEKYEDQKTEGAKIMADFNAELKRQNLKEMTDYRIECKSELEKTCKGWSKEVPLQLRCLNAANEIKPESISKACKDSLKLNQIRQTYTRVRWATCAKDFKKVCKGVSEVPRSNIKKCLLKEFKHVSKPCQTAMREEYPDLINEKLELIKK